MVDRPRHDAETDAGATRARLRHMLAMVAAGALVPPLAAQLALLATRGWATAGLIAGGLVGAMLARRLSVRCAGGITMASSACVIGAAALALRATGDAWCVALIAGAAAMVHAGLAHHMRSCVDKARHHQRWAVLGGFIAGAVGSTTLGHGAWLVLTVAAAILAAAVWPSKRPAGELATDSPGAVESRVTMVVLWSVLLALLLFWAGAELRVDLASGGADSPWWLAALVVVVAFPLPRLDAKWRYRACWTGLWAIGAAIPVSVLGGSVLQDWTTHVSIPSLVAVGLIAAGLLAARSVLLDEARSGDVATASVLVLAACLGYSTGPEVFDAPGQSHVALIGGALLTAIAATGFAAVKRSRESDELG